MMIVVMSDIHSNLNALEVVLDYAKNRFITLLLQVSSSMTGLEPMK